MKMSSPEKRPSLVHLQRLRTPALIVLLLFVETLLGLRFECPELEETGIVYCLLYLFLPASFLVISNLLLRSRRTSSASLPPPDAHIMYLIIELGKAPLIWVFIILLNREFLSCLFRNVHTVIQRRLFPSLQICGLVLLVLCVTLDYYSPRFPFLQKHLQYYNRRRHEELVLREIEVVVQEAADMKRKAYAQSMISPHLGELNPEDPGMPDVMLHLIQQYQAKVQQGSAGERRAEPTEQGGQSEGPLQTP
ncbi:uncharacterized protein LOC122938802 [Bufo gargarizans]|uniref:uncharacterized protein LOC122938802 n=1 Tax=Bufo gargarizans TaxID=30331 RepID=UPI001CF4E6F0|nr:uncharacterized protein LOC122938802 [Bufo gargarizans]